MEPISPVILPESEEGALDMPASSDKENSPEEVKQLREKLKRIGEELKRNREQMKRNEEELEKNKEELKRTKWQLKDIAQRKKVFYQMNLLSSELRELVYSKMPLFDRVSAARASEEMEEYFLKNRLTGVTDIYLNEENSKHYVKVVYSIDSTSLDPEEYGPAYVEYTEMHLIPDEMLHVIQSELQSSDDCECEFCRDIGLEDDKNVRYFRDGNLNAVFHSMRLFITREVQIKSSPIGGLVDLIQPLGQLVGHRGCSGRIFWHPDLGNLFIRNDPRLNLDNWRKWFEFWSFSSFYFYHKYVGVYIHRDFFELQVLKDARSVQSACNADINFRQLIQLKCRWLKFEESVKLNYMTPYDMLELYKAKIKEWIDADDKEEKEIDFEFEWIDNTPHPLHMDYRRLFGDMKAVLNPKRYRLYANSLQFWRDMEYEDYGRKDNITIRCMETNHCLAVTANRLMSGEMRKKRAHKLPDYLRF